MNVPKDLQNIATKDLATKGIEEDLLEACKKGQDQVNNVVDERLPPCAERKAKFRDLLPKTRFLISPSFFKLGHIDSVIGKVRSFKADRKLKQRLITA